MARNTEERDQSEGEGEQRLQPLKQPEEALAYLAAIVESSEDAIFSVFLAGIMDSQSVKTTEAGAPKGYDGGKIIAGRKRHLFVDTLGLIWGLAVLPAAPTDGDGAVEVFRRVNKSLPRLAKVWADSAYGVESLFAWIRCHCRWVLDVVKKRPGQTTFEVQKWRWIVERTFGWFNRYRRLSKDYEHNPKSSETWIYIAMIHRMSRFSLPDKNKDEDLLKRPPKRLKT